MGRVSGRRCWPHISCSQPDIRDGIVAATVGPEWRFGKLAQYVSAMGSTENSISRELHAPQIHNKSSTSWMVSGKAAMRHLAAPAVWILGREIRRDVPVKQVTWPWTPQDCLGRLTSSEMPRTPIVLPYMLPTVAHDHCGRQHLAKVDHALQVARSVHSQTL